ncbi:MAG TPA: enolase C-terminal domain-like protein [Terriglobia bacterium]|nr:enolase C-terminal domain-like protein [Terriglobia bacterium]
MDRREYFKLGVAGAMGAALSAQPLAAQEQEARATRGLPTPIIKDIQVIATQPAGVRLVVVKIITDQPGLYGYGCATFTQRADLVVPAVEKYLKPLLVGMPADRIEDTWQACYNSSYWRNGGVLNNAISGVDQALWDIKGRQANMPVYQLLGGKAREAALVYGTTGGTNPSEAVDRVRGLMDKGFKVIKVMVGVPGMSSYGPSSGPPMRGLWPGPVWEPGPYMRLTQKMLGACRTQLGDEIELIHDVHERVSPHQAVQFAKELEPIRLFYLEDVLSPEHIDYFRQIRQQCSTSLSMGELFNNPHEWQPLIEGRLIDYIRVHVSQAGGLTPARKIAILCEMYGVKTAWHGPGDVSPVGHTAQLHLDLASSSFGIQEGGIITGLEAEMFKGCATYKDGYLYASDKPGWGIEVDEALAAKYPFRDDREHLNGGWGIVRRYDGAVINQ